MAGEWCPGWEGRQGPFPGFHNQVHVYARDIHSGAGNCVCGGDVGDWIHIQAAPGVLVRWSQRRGDCPRRYWPQYDELGVPR